MYSDFYSYLEHDQSGQLSGQRACVDVILSGQVSKPPNINLLGNRNIKGLKTNVILLLR